MVVSRLILEARPSLMALVCESWYSESSSSIDVRIEEFG